MQSASSKPLIFVIVSVLVVALVYSPSSTFGVDNKANAPGTNCVPTGNKVGPTGSQEMECCWTVSVPPGTGNPDIGGVYEMYCSTCQNGGTRGMINCSEPELQFRSTRGPFAPGFPTAPLGGVFQSQPSGPAIPPGGGVLETPSAPPRQGDIFNTPQTGGVFNALPPPTEEGTQPPTLTEEPAPVCPEGQVLVEESGLCVLEDCPEGQVLDEEAGLCVLEEPEVAEEEPEVEESEQSEPEEQEQTTEEESDSSDESN